MLSSNYIVVSNYEYRGKLLELTLLLDSKKKPQYVLIDSEERKSIIGNWYLAKVENIVENIQGAFLQIGNGTKAFMPLNPKNEYVYIHKNANNNRLCQGDEILVEIKKDALKTKDALADSNILLDGSHMILSSLDHKVGISQKIQGELREKLQSVFSIWCEQNQLGLILRTRSLEQSVDELLEEADALADKYHQLLEKASYKNEAGFLYKRSSKQLDLILSCDANPLEKILCDSTSTFEFLYNCLAEHPKYQEKLSLYKDTAYPISALYSFSSILDNLIKQKVYLPSGGDIFIEQMETLTAIDVNSGKNAKKKMSAYDVNIEAAEAIALELTRRNIYGMILIDFINMKSKQEQIALKRKMIELTQNDFCKVSVLDFTKLGLLEITREKTFPTAKEMLTK